ncbi:hypothetical protein NX722_10440 [Endozoicomonas gorgoniicola]|uniref:Uncharacterized protein n=1 Tax=Endozoicomonas gorgoniicola TaxID=1234144 RepID=A0ABT3MUJ1_9GAMM|nr:hypothetical protein [Endozoicomonas gorgoniicola]MCW7553047.1 hypothetical protein [Endozoicomonas gorgoniicola]
MNNSVRLIMLFVAMTLPCSGYSGDDLHGAELALTTAQLIVMLNRLIGSDHPGNNIELNSVEVSSFNRDHFTSDYCPPEMQTVNGVLRVSATFEITPESAELTAPEPRDLELRVAGYFSTILPILTQYFVNQFTQDSCLGFAHLDRYLSESEYCYVADSDDDNSDDDNSAPQASPASLEGNSELCVASASTAGAESSAGAVDGAGAESSAEAGAVAVAVAVAARKTCQVYQCSKEGCRPYKCAPNWGIHMTLDEQQRFLTVEANLLYSGILNAKTERDKDEYEGEDEDEDENEVDWTRKCIDLYNNGLDRGLSKHLSYQKKKE